MTQETQTGTLEELNVQPGYVVEFVGGETTGFIIGKHYECVTGKDGLGRPAIGPVNEVGGCIPMSYANLTFRLISRATPYTLAIEVGKYYKTRDGRKVGPMELEFDGDFMANHPDLDRFTISWRPDGSRYKYDPDFDLIAEWTDTPPTWGEMTDAEKGALLLAHHEGKVIEYHSTGMNVWYKWNNYEFNDNGCGCLADNFAYRIKPEPLVETVVAYAQPELGGGFEVNSSCEHWPYRITFTTTNGEPDLDSIKMERIND